MLEKWLVTAPAVLFLVVLFGGGAWLRRRNIDMDGTPPIPRPAYAASKYLIMVVWAAAVAQSWGRPLSWAAAPAWVTQVALGLWLLGFALLFIGRLGLGDSFRIGSAKEATRLKVNGLFRLSRNPMYVGVYATLLAAVLYTRHPVAVVLAGFIIAVHHRIVLAEERHLRGVFGQEYADYCGRVRRYL